MYHLLISPDFLKEQTADPSETAETYGFYWYEPELS